MDKKAKDILFDYILRKYAAGDVIPAFDIFIVWQCKTLQNWKGLLITTLPDQEYYELTYNGDKHEWYLDAYTKSENICIKE